MMVTVPGALRGWQGGPSATYDWAKVLLTLRQEAQLTTAGKQLVQHLGDAAGESTDRLTYLSTLAPASHALACPSSLLIGRHAFLWSRGP
jgi:hypothetical protein